MFLVDWITEPLQLAFMQRALIAAILVGGINGVIGTFVVVRGMSFFGDALAHTILPGVAIAFIISGGTTGPALFTGGLIAGVSSALGIGWLTRGERVNEDTATGIVFVAMFALGIAIISSDPRAYQTDLVHILFGNIFAINSLDLWIMAGAGFVVTGVIALLFKELVIISFDQGLARALRLPAEGLRILLLVLIAVAIVASLQIVGIALMLAMLITPAATARLVTHRIQHMIIISALLGITGSVLGLYVSYYLNITASPAIVLVTTGLFILTFSFQQIRDYLARIAHQESQE